MLLLGFNLLVMHHRADKVFYHMVVIMPLCRLGPFVCVCGL